MGEKVFVTHSRIETEQLACKFAENLLPGTILAMRGDLGSGKTCFTAGLAKGLGYTGDVNSPTFAIVNVYEGGRLNLYHFDMYRISGWEDLYTTGYFDYIEEGGVTVIEWSENIESAIPDYSIYVTIKNIGENDRKIIIEGLKDENSWN